MRLVPFRFATLLPILTVFSVLAYAQGATPSQTTLLPAVSPGGPTGFNINVRPGAGVKPPFTAPTGTVTLYNGTAAVDSPATLTAESGVTSATFAQVFGTPDASVAKVAGGAVWGDFNEDGLPDLLVYGATKPGQPGLAVQVFTGSAQSLEDLTTPSFTPLAAQQLALSLNVQNGDTLAVLDVDGDGHLDLLAGNTVAYGKGDGTFGRVAVLPALASGYNQTYAVDINGDGKTDIVAIDTPPAVTAPGTVQYAFTVFHNAGGGTFTAMGPYPLAPSFAAGSSASYNIFGLSFADVNGDGRIDVLSQSNSVFAGNAASENNLNIMLNLGTGFGAPQAIDTTGVPNLSFAWTAFADLNGDGKQDLIVSYVANTMNSAVATFLGNGDGTFATPVNFPIGSTLIPGSLLSLAVEDFNADGKPDVALGSGVLLLGNGDGTLTTGTPLFASGTTFPNPPPAYAVLTAPPANGIPGGSTAAATYALFYMNLQAGANAVFLPNVGSSATVLTMLGPGTYSLTAHYSGDATYAASESNTIRVTVMPVAPKITVTSSANPSYSGESVTITATINAFFAGPTGSVTFSDGATALGTVQVSNGAASYTGSFSSAGNHTITASYSGDADNLATSGSLTQAVDAPVTVSSGSGGSTSLSVASGQSVTTPLKVSGAAGFSGQVNFSCTGLPVNAACSFNPASVTIAGTSASTTTLTVSTLATTTATARGESLRTATVVACGLPLLGLLMLVPVARGRRLLICLCFVLFVSAAGLSGCGGSSDSNKTPPGSYTFQVVATSGSATSTANYTLTVK